MMQNLPVIQVWKLFLQDTKRKQNGENQKKVNRGIGKYRRKTTDSVLQLSDQSVAILTIILIIVEMSEYGGESHCEIPSSDQ